jgi:hypothetical protein
VLLVYAGVLPIWLLFLFEWVWAVWWRHADVAVDLHHWLVALPVIQLLHGALSLLAFSACPWRTTGAILAGLWVLVSVFKEPIMLVCLLIVAKGWGITRPTLASHEVLASSLLVVLLYFAIGATFFHWGAVVATLVVWSAMLVNVVSSNLTNLRILKSQLLALRTFNLDATTTPAYTKYRMFSSLLLYTAFYYVADLALFVVATRQGLAPRWLTTLLRQLLELTTAFLIGYAFRARPLNVMFEQVESEAVEVARDLLPSLTTVTVDVHAHAHICSIAYTHALIHMRAERRIYTHHTHAS